MYDCDNKDCCNWLCGYCTEPELYEEECMEHFIDNDLEEEEE